MNETTRLEPKYLDNIVIAFKLGIEDEQITKNMAEKLQNNDKDLHQVYYQIIEKMLDDQILNDRDQFLKYGEYENALYMAAKDFFGKRNKWTDNSKMEYV